MTYLVGVGVGGAPLLGCVLVHRHSQAGRVGEPSAMDALQNSDPLLDRCLKVFFVNKFGKITMYVQQCTVYTM